MDAKQGDKFKGTVGALRFAAFTVETVGHLQGREATMLPIAQRAYAAVAVVSELLAACKAMVAEREEQVVALGWASAEAYDKSHGPDEPWAMLRAAIAKAERQA